MALFGMACGEPAEEAPADEGTVEEAVTEDAPVEEEITEIEETIEEGAEAVEGEEMLEEGEEMLEEGEEMLEEAGEMIEEETLEGAIECIEAGADGLALSHLLPPELVGNHAEGSSLVTCGKGRILVADEFDTDGVRQFVRPHLGPSDRIRYDVGARTVEVRAADGYGGGLVLDTELEEEPSA